MAKQHHSPLLGYNNNVRHKNRVFHIQTEDSGVKHPHIITHLFMDGGRILKSVKKSYAEHIGGDAMADTVRQMMKEQHKAMFIALRDGQFDQLVEEHVAATVAKNAGQASGSKVEIVAAAPVPDDGSAPILPASTAPDDGSAPLLPAARDSAPIVANPAQGPVDPRAKTEAAMPSADQTVPMPAVAMDASPPPPAPAKAAKLVVLPDAEEVPATTREVVKHQELTLDIEALERAAHEPSAMYRSTDLPPPPQNLFKDKPTTGSYRTLDPIPEERPAEPVPDSRRRGSPQAPGVRKSATPSPHASVAKSGAKPAPSRPAPRGGAAASSSSGSGRYAPARPAAIFGQPKPQTSSIFGDDLISDKSLDEVILSYLAEDLEPPKKR